MNTGLYEFKKADAELASVFNRRYCFNDHLSCTRPWKLSMFVINLNSQNMGGVVAYLNHQSRGLKLTIYLYVVTKVVKASFFLAPVSNI